MAGNFSNVSATGRSIFLTRYNIMSSRNIVSLKYIWLSYCKTENQLNLLGKDKHNTKHCIIEKGILAVCIQEFSIYKVLFHILHLFF